MELIDFHAHILPHMDHGSRHTETACEQLSLMHAAGIDTVCATSHFYPHNTLPDEFLKNRDFNRDHLFRAFGDAPRPTLLMGAEVLICPDLDKMEGIERLCVEGTRILLLEMPFDAKLWDKALHHTIRNLVRKDILPVLAHVDRYPRESIAELFEYGLLGQVNASALDRFFKPKYLLDWIDDGHIVALGSDLHGSDPKSYAPYTKFVRSMPARAEMIMEATANLLAEAIRY